MQEDQAELLKKITSLLDNSNIEYMITGAWSVIFYGRPRASHDIDFVIELEKKDFPKAKKLVSQIKNEFAVQEDSIKEAIEKKDMFNFFHLSTGLKIDFWLLTNDEFDKMRFSRRIKVPILDKEMVISTAEDTILQKLRWHKKAKIEKHLIDAAFVYQIQKENLTQKYLKDWAKKLKVEEDLEELEKINLEDYF